MTYFHSAWAGHLSGRPKPYIRSIKEMAPSLFPHQTVAKIVKTGVIGKVQYEPADEVIVDKADLPQAISDGIAQAIEGKTELPRPAGHENLDAYYDAQMGIKADESQPNE